MPDGRTHVADFGRCWRIATAVSLVATTVRCTLFVDSSGLAGGAVPADGAAGADERTARAARVIPAPAGDTSVGSEAAATTVPADAGRDAKVIPDAAKVWSGNGHAYLVMVHDGGVASDTAKQDAAALGGHLATISSAEENAWVSSYANTNDNAWSGVGGPYRGG